MSASRGRTELNFVSEPQPDCPRRPDFEWQNLIVRAPISHASPRGYRFGSAASPPENRPFRDGHHSIAPEERNRSRGRPLPSKIRGQFALAEQVIIRRPRRQSEVGDQLPPRLVSAAPDRDRALYSDPLRDYTGRERPSLFRDNIHTGPPGGFRSDMRFSRQRARDFCPRRALLR